MNAEVTTTRPAILRETVRQMRVMQEKGVSLPLLAGWLTKVYWEVYETFFTEDDVRAILAPKPVKAQAFINGINVGFHPTQEFSGALVLYAALEGEMAPFRKYAGTNPLRLVAEAIADAQESRLCGQLELRNWSLSLSSTLDVAPENWFARFEVRSFELVEDFDPDAKDEYTDRRGPKRRR